MGRVKRNERRWFEDGEVVELTARDDKPLVVVDGLNGETRDGSDVLYYVRELRTPERYPALGNHLRRLSEAERKARHAGATK